MGALAYAGSWDPSEFDRWWNSSGSWVEPPNRRRGGESGVQLLRQRKLGQLPLFCKRQTDHVYRTLWHPFGRPTILRELQAYQALSRLGIRVPILVYGAARRQPEGWQGVLVTEALHGFVSLEAWYASARSTLLRKAVLCQLAGTLARMHRAGWQHGCCYPKHIFVKIGAGESDSPRVEIALLDLEKSRRRWRFRDASRHDLGQLARHRGSMPEADLLFFQEAYRAAQNGQGGEGSPE